MLAPLKLVGEVCATPEAVERNIVATLDRGYMPFNGFLQPAHDRVISICGSAPSFVDTYTEIEGDVFACNAAQDFLVTRGVTPKYTMLWDADPVVTKLFTPQHGVRYLVASRCHPDVFERLEGYDVAVWHAGGDECLERLLNERNVQEPIVNGGSAAVVRAMFVAYAMGYRDIRLFGVDCSSRGKKTHLRDSVVHENELRVFCNGVWFETTPWLAMQAEDFKIIGPALRDGGTNIVVHGEGLIPHIAKELLFSTPNYLG